MIYPLSKAGICPVGRLGHTCEWAFAFCGTQVRWDLQPCKRLCTSALCPGYLPDLPWHPGPSFPCLTSMSAISSVLLLDHRPLESVAHDDMTFTSGRRAQGEWALAFHGQPFGVHFDRAVPQLLLILAFLFLCFSSPWAGAGYRPC